MEIRGIGSPNFNKDVFGLVLVDPGGDEIRGLPLLNRRLCPQLRGEVGHPGGGGDSTHLVRLAREENGTASNS